MSDKKILRAVEKSIREKFARLRKKREDQAVLEKARKPKRRAKPAARRGTGSALDAREKAKMILMQQQERRNPGPYARLVLF